MTTIPSGESVLEIVGEALSNNSGRPIIGIRIDAVTGLQIDVPEVEHYFNCRACGQAVDMRDLGQVFHHEELNHQPHSLDA